MKGPVTRFVDMGSTGVRWVAKEGPAHGYLSHRLSRILRDPFGDINSHTSGDEATLGRVCLTQRVHARILCVARVSGCSRIGRLPRY